MANTEQSQAVSDVGKEWSLQSTQEQWCKQRNSTFNLPGVYYALRHSRRRVREITRDRIDTTHQSPTHVYVFIYV